MTNPLKFPEPAPVNVTWNGLSLGDLEPEFVQDHRMQAMADLQRIALPTQRDEDWKYTPLRSLILFPTLGLESKLSSEELDSLVHKHSVPGFDGYRLVLVNGRLYPIYSSPMRAEDQGVLTVLSFASAWNEPAMRQFFKDRAVGETEYFSAQNSAYFTEGLYLRVNPGRQLSRPLHILHILDSAADGMLQDRRLLIIGEKASIEVYETVVSTDTDHRLAMNQVWETEIGIEGRGIQVTMQLGHARSALISQQRAFLHRDSRFSNHTYTLRGAFTRNNLKLFFRQPGAEAYMYGFYQPRDGELIDNHTLADHLVPNCRSTEHYKGILSGNSTGVFNGKVVVHANAQKTNAYQQNNSVLLGTQATMNSKPELEIFADDVKCSHGSTIGQLNAEALFYLQARGIGAETAKLLLMKAFAYELTERLAIPFRNYLNDLIGSYV